MRLHRIEAFATVDLSYVERLRDDPEVARVAPPQPSDDGRAALIAVEPRHDPESPLARGLLDRLRSDELTGVAKLDVGGNTASVEDFKDLVSGSMWKILVLVLLFSYLVRPPTAWWSRCSSGAGSTACSATTRSAISTR